MSGLLATCGQQRCIVRKAGWLLERKKHSCGRLQQENLLEFRVQVLRSEDLKASVLHPRLLSSLESRPKHVNPDAPSSETHGSAC